MAKLDRKKALANMEKKGFVEGRAGKHIPYNYVTTAGKKTAITTHVSHTPKHKMLSDFLISSMAEQCKLGKSDFVRFAECKMDQREYELRLIGGGHIKKSDTL